MDKPLRSLTLPGLPDTYVVPEAKDGASAYDLAVQQGFSGSLDDWLASLKGDPGTNFIVKAYYESLSALESAVPAPTDGDVYGIGTGVPYSIYVWDAVHNKWVNNGYVQGPIGHTGYVFTPSVNSDGTLSWTNDGGLDNPTPVNIKGEKGNTGEKGTTGATGTTFTPTVSTSGVISWTNDGEKTNPESINLVSAVLNALPTWTGGSY